MEKFLVGNSWRGGDGESFESLNPADGTLVATVAQASARDVDDAVRAAQAAVAEPAWRDMLPHRRARLLSRFADLIDQNREHLVELQTLDNGKTIEEGRQHAAAAADKFRYFAAVCETMESQVVPARGAYHAYTTYEPIGVVAAMTAFNSPILHEAGKLAPILAAGNAIVLKSSEVTPLIGLQYARIALEAGLPPGIVNVVTGDARVGRALVNHPGVNMIAFTGGTRTGREIGKAAAERIVPCLLELGGKSPNIVFEDANLDDALIGMLYGIFSNAGQSCIAGSRILVQASIYQRFVERLVEATRKLKVGSPLDPATAVAPVASFRQRDVIEALVARGLAAGARLLVGGSRPRGGILDRGAYFEPTLMEVTDPANPIAQEEVFGPVGCVMKFDDEEDLYRLANGTEFGLACGIWTNDYRRALRAARRIQSGMVWVNTYKLGATNMPFGGYKQSGIGRENGPDGMRAFMQVKSMYLNMSTGPIAWP